jgi:hypothetical protein
MSERALFACDGCGTEFGHLNELIPIPVRRSRGEFRHPTEERLHVCLACDEERGFPSSLTNGIKWFGVGRATGSLRVEAIVREFGDGREEVVTRPEISDERLLELFEFIEAELLAGGSSEPTDGNPIVADGGEVEPSPSERADEIRLRFIECVEAYESEGEPRNLILSDEMREAVEWYLKPMAEVIEEASNGPLLGEMAINVVSEEFPHQTKGAAREALTEYLGGEDDQLPD